MLGDGLLDVLAQAGTDALEAGTDTLVPLTGAVREDTGDGLLEQSLSTTGVGKRRVPREDVNGGTTETGNSWGKLPQRGELDLARANPVRGGTAAEEARDVAETTACAGAPGREAHRLSGAYIDLLGVLVEVASGRHLDEPDDRENLACIASSTFAANDDARCGGRVRSSGARAAAAPVLPRMHRSCPLFRCHAWCDIGGCVGQQ